MNSPSLLPENWQQNFHEASTKAKLIDANWCVEGCVGEKNWIDAERWAVQSLKFTARSKTLPTDLENCYGNKYLPEQEVFIDKVDLNV